MFKTLIQLNSFHATCLLLYPLKTSENQGFYDIFKGYRNRRVARNELTTQRLNFIQPKNQKPFLQKKLI